MNASGAPILSLIVPVYYNEATLEDLYRTVARTFDGFMEPDELEIVFIDDGSGDGSFKVLRDLAARDPERVRVLRMSRNFGSHAAILAGLSCCRGRYAALVGADLQDDPEIVRRMLDKAREDEADVVLACREAREEERSKVAFANCYYWIMRVFSQAKFPPGGFDCFLIERKVIRTLVDMGETNTSLSAQILWVGFRQSCIYYVKRERPSGKSRWTVRKKTRLLVDSVVSFSHAPVRFIEIVGGLTALSGFGYAAFIVVRRLAGIRDAEGWASLMVALLVLSGVMLLSLGIIGEYLWRILDAARRRPVFLIAETRNLNAESGSGQAERVEEVSPREEAESIPKA